MRARSGTVAAVDLGATSGRVLLGQIRPDRIHLEVVRRFENRPVETPDGLHWSVLELYRESIEGLKLATRRDPEVASVGLDTWAVDYGLLRGGRLLGLPYSYRDSRTARGVETVHERIGPHDLYRINGLQHLPFNTVFQLAVDIADRTLELADQFLLLPDLFGFWLTGVAVAETTNASTTGLLNASTGSWDPHLLRTVGIPEQLLPNVVPPGTDLGALSTSFAKTVGSTRMRLTTVGSHDTASAVVAIPATEPEVAYISCGTWSLVGVELERPVLTEDARLAGFTNEGGVDGRIRFLHNVMGLWILSESIREWRRRDERVDLIELLDQAADVTENVAVFDADDPDFLTPGDMPTRIREWLSSRGLPIPSSRASLVRSILLSLATSYSKAIRSACELSGHSVRTVHIVGGGSLNSLLCQFTADITGLPVVAGPSEATALGNVLVQARSLGWIDGDLEAMRALVVRDVPTIRYEPRPVLPNVL